jgi:hypothetical protein
MALLCPQFPERMSVDIFSIFGVSLYVIQVAVERELKEMFYRNWTDGNFLHLKVLYGF